MGKYTNCALLLIFISNMGLCGFFTSSVAPTEWCSHRSHKTFTCGILRTCAHYATPRTSSQRADLPVDCIIQKFRPPFDSARGKSAHSHISCEMREMFDSLILISINGRPLFAHRIPARGFAPLRLEVLQPSVHSWMWWLLCDGIARRCGQDVGKGAPSSGMCHREH